MKCSFTPPSTINVAMSAVKFFILFFIFSYLFIYFYGLTGVRHFNIDKTLAIHRPLDRNEILDAAYFMALVSSHIFFFLFFLYSYLTLYLVNQRDCDNSSSRYKEKCNDPPESFSTRTFTSSSINHSGATNHTSPSVAFIRTVV